jgi:hypothetical protein
MLLKFVVPGNKRQIIAPARFQETTKLVGRYNVVLKEGMHLLTAKNLNQGSYMSGEGTEGL